MPLTFFIPVSRRRRKGKSEQFPCTVFGVVVCNIYVVHIVKMSNKRLQQTQAQVDEVVDIMKVNVDKVLERDAKLSELDSRADQLQAGASQFEHSAARLKRKMWWQNCKMWLILIVVIIVIIVAIVVWVVANQTSDSKPTKAPATTTSPA